MPLKRKSKTSTVSTSNKLSRFQRLSLFFFLRPRKTAIIWLVVALFGALSFTTLLRREGFPAIETPFAITKGTYLVNDPAKVDSDAAKPLSEFLLKQNGVKTVQTQSFDNFFVATVAYNDNINAETRSAELQKDMDQQHVLPEHATGKLEAFKFGFTDRGDSLVISFFASDNTVSTTDLVAKATDAANYIKSQNLPLVEDVSIINPYETAINPATGVSEATQKSFDRFGKRDGDTNNFHNSIVIGVNAKDGADELELDKQVHSAVTSLSDSGQFNGYHAEISASNAPSIKMQVNELQTTLFEGLLAVLVVGSIVIAIRASIITVISMVTVIAIVNGLLFIFGFSLNTITLFGLVLGLSLIVDDTIIMVEAIDAQRRKRKDPKEVVKVATGKVGQAMIAATSTAALSFAPLLFVGGILGSFIRAIPITIIAALITSLFVALVFIPFFSRFLLLGEKQLGEKNVREPAAAIEARVARFLSAPMLWAQHSKKKLFMVGIAAVFIGLGFIGAGGYIFRSVKFSIFPADKDSNQLSVTIAFAPGTDINRAEQVTDDVDKIVSDSLGPNLVKADYYGTANIQTAVLNIDIIDYKDRDAKAPQIVDQLNDKLKNFSDATVKAGQLGNGPPASAFAARVDSSQNREGATHLATDIAAFLKTAELKRTDGSIAKIDSVTIPDPNVFTRDDNKQYIQAGAQFVDDDTSALVTIAQAAVEKEFPKDRVASYGVDQNALSFDFGQEAENQDSFKTLAIAFPFLLLAIYILLAFQFKSMLQPLLIFMAIPFSLFGITLGLYVSDNPFSFFSMLGFFALIGLSIKNTILLTDYANQSRRAGKNAIDAAHEALAERFRPLIATSLTAVVSLIPLAVTSPFWEGLAIVLICGLLSSTFLVVTVFPYYYLGAEYLRSHINRRTGILWIIVTAALIVALVKILPALAIVAPFVTGLGIALFKKRRRKAA
jgi:multidrug efflux pump subunit AcrB